MRACKNFGSSTGNAKLDDDAPIVANDNSCPHSEDGGKRAQSEATRLRMSREFNILVSIPQSVEVKIGDATILFCLRRTSVPRSRHGASERKSRRQRLRRAMKSKKLEKTFPVIAVEGRIHLVRERKVIFDRDLAELYGVSTRALNQAVKRNIQRFPEEFVFRLTMEEASGLISRSVTLAGEDPNRSQIVTGSQKHRDPRFLPYAFNEHGALMAANVLRSQRAIQMSVVIVQTFVRLSRLAVSMDALTRRVEELGRATSENSEQIKEIVAAIRELMTPPEKPPREIGFHAAPERSGSAAKRRKSREL